MFVLTHCDANFPDAVHVSRLDRLEPGGEVDTTYLKRPAFSFPRDDPHTRANFAVADPASEQAFIERTRASAVFPRRFKTPLTPRGLPVTLNLRSYDFFRSVAVSQIGVCRAGACTETVGSGVNSGTHSLPANGPGALGFLAATRDVRRQADRPVGYGKSCESGRVRHRLIGKFSLSNEVGSLSYLTLSFSALRAL